MAETGAFKRLIGPEKLAGLIKNTDALTLVVSQGNGGNPSVVGFLVAYSKQLALENHPDLATDYAPLDSVWFRDFIYIKSVGIHPDATGQGLARKLLDHCVHCDFQINSEAVVARIAVDPLNSRSVRLLARSFGCAEIGRKFDEESQIAWGVFKGERLYGSKGE